ncbi:hypothetical protein SEA_SCOOBYDOOBYDOO_39 [Mycobacterium phage ScoobyDoobyDoo]|nr:hypothetical protein SEA_SCOOBYDOOBYDOO_39 [Mycobacterium phage ScoobyDoobyDoo]
MDDYSRIRHCFVCLRMGTRGFVPMTGQHEGKHRCKASNACQKRVRKNFREVVRG